MAFRLTPLEAIDIMFFSPPHGATVNELLSVIEVPDYSELELVATVQRKIFYRDSVTGDESGFLKDMLPEMEKEEEHINIAGDFLEFATGSRYLPQRPTECNFKIVIEFHNTMSYKALPEAHTCVKVVKFPSSAYDGDKETFREKLLLALENKEFFTMV
jgi:hypothetical protein